MATILFAGDFCPQGRVNTLLDEYIKNKDFGAFSCIKDLTKSVDYSIVNLEAPVLTEEETYKPIQKCGPNLRAPESAVDFLGGLGFTMFTLANNHILDYGDKGLNNTIKECHRVGVDVVGAGANLEKANEVVYKDIAGNRFAFINCCEHEYSIATCCDAGANPLSPISQYYKIIEAKEKSDYVVVIIHGGVENYSLPTPRMKELYRFFIDVGADAVINHHQHCFSGYELYNDKPIFYGLGNFSFDWQNMPSSWYEGYLVILDFNKKVQFRIIPYEQAKSSAIRLLNSEEESKFKSSIAALNCVIDDFGKLKDNFDNFADTTTSDYEYIISPWSISYTISWFKKHILPNYFRKRKWLWLQNTLMCESHFERFMYLVDKKVK